MIKIGLSFSSVGAGVGAPVVGDGVGTDVDGLTVGAGVGLGVGFGVGLGVESAVGAVVDGHAPQVIGQICWTRFRVAGLGWAQNATSWLQEAGFPNKVIPVTSASVHTSPGWSLRVSKTDAVDAVDAAGSTANPTGNSTAHAVGLDVFGERVGLMVRTPAATGCCSKRKRSEAPRADIVPGTLDMVD